MIENSCTQKENVITTKFDEIQTFHTEEYVQIEYIFDITGMCAAIVERGEE